MTTWYRHIALVGLLTLALGGIAMTQEDQAAAIQRAVTALAATDQQQRSTAQQELIQIGAPAVEALITAAKDPAYAARALALRILGEIHDSRAVPVMVEAMKDPSADIRRTTAAALGAVNDPQAVAPLLAALHDANPWVREAAILALGAYQDSRILPALIAYLKAGDPEAFAQSLAEGSGAPYTMNAAVIVLVKIGAPAVDPLLTVLKKGSTEGRMFAAVALGQLKETRAVEPILASVRAWKPTDMRALYSTEPPPKTEPERATWVKKRQQLLLDATLNNFALSAYLTALGNLNDRRAIAPLIAILQNDDPSARRMASRALTQITGQQFGENYEQWQQWWKAQDADKR